MTKNKDIQDVLKTLEKTLGHSFTDNALLLEALTHPSRDGEPNYQRLEFLGDRVLGLVIAAIVYETYPKEAEGKLNRRYATLVRKETLSEISGALKLDALVRMTDTMERSGGRDNPSIRSDVLEALIGALFLDGGYKAAKDFIAGAWQNHLEGKTAIKDAKSTLQEWAQGQGKPLPAYEVVKRAGPDHAPAFWVEVTVEGLGSATARGASKRVAEIKAADKLIKKAGV